MKFELEQLRQYNAESPFEALVQFKNETFEIWMNNSRIDHPYNTTAGFSVVNYVQVKIN